MASMVAVPALTPVTTPDAFTVANAGVSLVHVTALLVALEGVIETLRVMVLPACTDCAAVGVIAMLDTFTSGSGSGPVSQPEPLSTRPKVRVRRE